MAAPSLSNGTASNPPAWDTTSDLKDGDTVQIDFTVDGSAPDGTADDTHTLISTDETIGWPTLGTVTAGVTVKISQRYGRVINSVLTYSAWSNVLTITPVATWTPAAYFVTNTSGGIPPRGIYFPISSSTCFTDTSGTTAVTAVGQSVAYVKDQSGNGVDMVQSTAGQRPTYQTTTGVFGTGLPYLLFDGVDDRLQSGQPSLGGPWTQPIFTGYSIKAANTATKYLTDSNTTPVMAILQTAGGWGMDAGASFVASIAADTNDDAITGLFNGVSSYIRKNGVQGTTIDSGGNTAVGMTMGASSGGSLPWSGRWYGGFRIYINPTGTQRTFHETWLTGQHP